MLDIVRSVKQYMTEEKRMYNLTRMVFYLECALNLKIMEFIRLTYDLDRPTIIKFTLMYYVNDVAQLTTNAIQESIKNYHEFGAYFIDAESLPEFPAIFGHEIRSRGL